MYLVTGASSGIGRATATALAERGVDVLAVARRQLELDELRRKYPRCVKIVIADLGCSAGIDAVLNACGEHGVQGIIHAAGTSISLGDYRDLQGEQLLSAMAVHVNAPILLNAALLEKKRCRVVYIDSYSASAPREGWAAYSIIKAAAQMAARAAALELVNADVIRVFPGGVKTDLVTAVLESDKDCETVRVFKALDADGALATPAEIGQYMTSILLDATDAQLAEREFWDFNNKADQLF